MQCLLQKVQHHFLINGAHWLFGASLNGAVATVLYMDVENLGSNPCLAVTFTKPAQKTVERLNLHSELCGGRMK